MSVKSDEERISRLVDQVIKDNRLAQKLKQGAAQEFSRQLGRKDQDRARRDEEDLWDNLPV